MPMSLSAMLIASPIPRVPPVTIATRAIAELPSIRRARLFPGHPARKLAFDQPFEHGDAFGRIVEAVEQSELLAARMHEAVAPADSELLERFDAVGGEAGRCHGDAADAVLRISGERRVGGRLEPLRPAEFRLEGDVDLAAQDFAEQARRFLAVTMIGIP